MTVQPKPVLGVRQRQREQTIAAIEQSALGLFAVRSVDDVTVDEIAVAAGVSRRTFFRYFPGGKEEVLLLDLRRRMGEVERILAERPPHEPALSALRASLLALASGYEKDRESAMDLANILVNTPAIAARILGEQLGVMRSLQDMIAIRLAADPETDLRPGVIVAASIAAVQVAFQLWTDGGGEDLVALVSQALDLVDEGFSRVGRRLATVPTAEDAGT